MKRILVLAFILLLALSFVACNKGGGASIDDDANNDSLDNTQNGDNSSDGSNTNNGNADEENSENDDNNSENGGNNSENDENNADNGGDNSSDDENESDNNDDNTNDNGNAPGDDGDSDEEEDNAHTHTMTRIESVGATCSSEGNIEHYMCSECKKLYSDENGTIELTASEIVIPKSDVHTGGTEVRGEKDSTEDEEGYTGDTYCLGCGDKIEDGKSIDKLPHTHSMTKTDGSEASCTEDGNVEYYTCSKCNKLYSDEDGKNEISKADTVIKAGHKLVYRQAQDGSCSEPSYMSHWYCTVCFKYFSDANAENELQYVEMPSEGHSGGTELRGVKESTEDEYGYTGDLYCLGCGNVIEYGWQTNKLPHTHSMTKIEKVEATCTDDGNIEYYVCSKCNKKYSDFEGNFEVTEVLIPKTHIGKFVTVGYKEATEEEAGYSGDIYCLGCGEKTEDGQIIDKLVHYHSMVKTNRVEATCTEDGNIEYYTCSGCDKLFSDMLGTVEIILADTVISKGHTGGTRVLGAKEATEDEEGYTGDTYCLGCGTKIATGKVIDKLPHTKHIPSTIYRVEPTCTDEGNIEYYICAKCNKLYSDESCTNEITQADTIILPRHIYENDKCLSCGKERVSEGLAYDLNMGGASYVVSGINTCTDSNIIIPSTYNDMPVVAIGERAFYNRVGITSVKIPDSVTSIGDSAFYSCSSLASVSISNSVTSIGNYAFYNCSSLTVVSLPNGLSDVGYSAFDGCIRITEMVLPNRIKSIPYSLFRNCESLVSVTIPENVTTIGDSAFNGCTALEKIYFNATSMTDLNSNNYVFANAGMAADGIKVIIGNNVTKIPEYLFYPVNKNYDYSPKVISLKFAEESVCESIGAYSFYRISTLESVHIPSGLKTIGVYAFYCAAALSEIRYDATEMNDMTESAYIFSGVGTQASDLKVIVDKSVTKIPVCAFYSLRFLKTVEFEEGSLCKIIGDKAFYGCESLENIITPASIDYVGANAFYGCNNLSYTEYENAYYIGNSTNPYVLLMKAKEESINSCSVHPDAQVIVDRAFSGCTMLTSISFEEKSQLKMIGIYVFASCSTLECVEIPASVTYIGTYAFSNCTELLNVIFDDAAYLEIISDYAFYQCSTIQNITIPDSVVTIGSNAFGYCTSLTEIDFGQDSKLNSIGKYAFYNCSSLEKIIISKNVASIGDSAFRNCYAVENICFDAISLNYTLSNNFADMGKNGEGVKVVIGKNATKIPAYLFYTGSAATAPKIVSIKFEDGSACESVGNSAFSGCSNLKELTLPESIKFIDNNAFYNCTALTEIFFNAIEMNDLESSTGVFYNAGNAGDGIKVVIGKNVTKIPDDLFSSSYIISVAFEEGSVCESIGNSAFSGCSNLKELILPESIENVCDYAFSGCGIINAVIPNSVTYLGFGAFSSAGNLTSVMIGDGVTIIDKNVFNGCKNLTTVIGGNNINAIGDYSFYNCEKLVTITISNNVTSVGEYAFFGCKSLKSVNIPESVVSIGECAFRECVLLEEISFDAIRMNDLQYDSYAFMGAGVNGNGIKLIVGKNVVKIPEYLFHVANNTDASNLTTVEFENGSVCETIGLRAFYNCINLRTITITESVRSINYGAFYNTPKLECIYFNAVNMCDLEAYNDVFYYAGTNVDGWINGRGLKVIIGKEVTKIPAYLFYSSNNAIISVKNVTFDEGSVCQSIGNFAFCSSNGISSLTLPESLMSIGAYAFYDCKNLTSVVFGSNLNLIENFAFSGCSKLQKATFAIQDGWWYALSSTDESGTAITELSNASVAAEYLRNTYRNCYWKRS